MQYCTDGISEVKCAHRGYRMKDHTVIIGYHGTCSKHLNSIVKYGLDPAKVKKRTDHWLGQGIYFYKDMQHAEWWAEDQCTKPYNRNTYPIIFRARLSAEKERILDLDESMQLDFFFDFMLQTWEEINEYYADEKPEFTPETFRAVYFDYFKQINNIAIIIYTFSKKIAGYGKRRGQKDIKLIKDFSRIFGLTYHETQICVSDKSLSLIHI